MVRPHGPVRRLPGRRAVRLYRLASADPRVAEQVAIGGIALAGRAMAVTRLAHLQMANEGWPERMANEAWSSSWANAVLAVVGALFVPRYVVTLAQRDREPAIRRRFVHVSSGVVAAGLPLVLTYGEIVVLTAGFVPFLVVARRVGLFPAVSGVERSTLGEVWFPLGVLLPATLFPADGPYVYGVLVMGPPTPPPACGGDATGAGGTRFRAAAARPGPGAAPSC